MYTKVEEVDGGYAPILKIKGLGRVDLGVYDAARKAAVAHDVARLVCLHEKRPDTDLRMDAGLMHPVDGYLVDPQFNQLLDSKASFDSVCELLKSGALVDNFLCAQDRQTRSNTSGERPPQRRQQQQQPHAQQPAQLQRNGSGAIAVAKAPHASRAAQAAGEGAATIQQEAVRAKQGTQQAPAQPHSHKSSADTQMALPLASQHEAAGSAPPRAGAAPAAAAALTAATTATADTADEAAGSPSPAKKKAMRWLEWPTKGGGQFVSCVSERALKSSMTLPVKMKRELFQVTDSPAAVDAYDLQPGSSQRWAWEVRDYAKEERRVTSIHHLGAFFKHYAAVPGDVMVVVASAPGAVKATIWKGEEQEAAEFKAFQERQSERAAEKQGRQPASSGARKRAADGPADKAGAVSKAAKASSDKAQAAPPRSGAAAPAATAPPSLSPDGSRALSKTGSGPQRLQHQVSVHQRQQQASPAQQQQQQGAGQRPTLPPVRAHPSAAAHSMPPRASPPAPRQARQGVVLPVAESGVAPVERSHPSGDDTQAMSPTAQVAQSPFRHQALPPLASMAVPIKQEQQDRASSPLVIGEPDMDLDPAAAAAAAPPSAAAAAAGPGAAGEAGAAATHSPARLSCADASQLLGQQAAGTAGGATQQQQQQQPQAAVSQPAASGAGAGPPPQELPDPMALVNDEGAVYMAMARLLTVVTSTGRVPVEAVNAYRRSFMRLEPHGKRWFAYDSLKQLVDAAEWGDVHAWMLCK